MKNTTTVDTRKTIDHYDIEGLYCGEWSVECSEDTYGEARKTLKEYQDNCPQTAFRIKHRIEKNPNFVLTLGALKKGDWFTLKPIAEPKDSQVYEKGDYDRSDSNRLIYRRIRHISSWSSRGRQIHRRKYRCHLLDLCNSQK